MGLTQSKEMYKIRNMCIIAQVSYCVHLMQCYALNALVIIFSDGKHFSNTYLSDLSIVGTCSIFVKPNASSNHVIHPIG